MSTVDRWQLPDGIEEVLPAQAETVEHLRRELLDLYRSWGYQLVIPPLMEFTESLLVGLGADLDILTFKMTDQVSGRALGVRADIAPQVARIDAHSLAEEGVTRLCYAGSTLHTRPKTLMASRSPIQLGAELYGDGSLAADMEVIRLMLTTLETCGLQDITLDLGHIGIYQAVLACAELTESAETAVFDALQRKSRPDLELALAGVPAKAAEPILALIDLHGEDTVLDRARDTYAQSAPAALPAIDALAAVAADVRQLRPDISIYFDLAELRGMHYHTGIVFAAYLPGHGQALANGGRYDDVGKVYGRARPATGFSADLKALMKLTGSSPCTAGAISLPDVRDDALETVAADLRAAGEIVINCPSGQHSDRCDRQLVREEGVWVVRPL